MLAKLLQIVVGVAAAAIIWGYWDASRVNEIKGLQASARLIDPYALNYDTMPSMQPFNRGQLFVALQWQQPAHERVAEIYLSGSIIENGAKFATFGEKCQRAGSTWLAEGKWTFRGNTATDLVCFIKLDKELPVGLEADGRNSLSDISANDARRGKMKFEGLTMRASGSKVPFRYVTWINENARLLKAWLLYPFERSL